MLILEKLDFYGKTFNLNLRGKESYNTMLGGIISLFIWIGTLGLLYYFGQELWLKQEPKYLSRIRYADQSPWISTDKVDFYFAIQVKDENYNYIYDPRYFTYFGTYQLWKLARPGQPEKNEKSKIIDSKQLTMKRCTQTTINSNKYNNYICANMSNSSFGGDFGDEYASYFTIGIKKCNKNTEQEYNITCANRTELNNLGLLYLTYMNYETQIDPSNYNNPIKDLFNFKDITFYLNQKHYMYEFYYSMSNLTTDTGLIFDDERTIQFLSFDYLLANVFDIDHENFLTIDILMNAKNIINSREYIKLPDVLAQV